MSHVYFLFQTGNCIGIVLELINTRLKVDKSKANTCMFSITHFTLLVLLCFSDAV